MRRQNAWCGSACAARGYDRVMARGEVGLKESCKYCVNMRQSLNVYCSLCFTVIASLAAVPSMQEFLDHANCVDMFRKHPF